MKNITLSAKEEDIERARAAAARTHRTLNDLFREWLGHLGNDQAQDDETAERLRALWQENSYLRVGKRLTRDEMNER